MNKIAVLIPAYQPEESLLQLVAKLMQKGLSVTIVDDGSGSKYASVFERARAVGCAVLTHECNFGKGRALKTGFRYLAEQDYVGVVTADADGQHTPQDICRVMECMRSCPGKLVLGSRDIKKMPLRSSLGNKITCIMFRVLYGQKITDTQTGLRGIPLNQNINELEKLEGERYEYETNLLIAANRLFDGVEEVQIETIYLNNNENSHFRPISDGVRIYRLLFKALPRFFVSSAISFLVDYILFNTFVYASGFSVISSTLGARIISGICNYTINKKVVFKNSGESYTLGRYVSLAVLILILNCGLIWVLTKFLLLPAFLAKILVECCLYVISFTVQNRFAQQ